jgi:hypothetical protein
LNSRERRIASCFFATVWYPFFSTDRNATAAEIIEAFADRATIEQDFHDVKEVWGAGQQQVRNIWTILAVYHLSLWIHALLELWSWNRPHDWLCDGSLSPWDDAERRPSHANQRKALHQHIGTPAEFMFGALGEIAVGRIVVSLLRAVSSDRYNGVGSGIPPRPPLSGTKNLASWRMGD